VILLFDDVDDEPEATLGVKLARLVCPGFSTLKSGSLAVLGVKMTTGLDTDNPWSGLRWVVRRLSPFNTISISISPSFVPALRGALGLGLGVPAWTLKPLLMAGTGSSTCTGGANPFQAWNSSALSISDMAD
jgi:hypothetical protein